jgi:hypothetical protein
MIMTNAQKYAEMWKIFQRGFTRKPPAADRDRLAVLLGYYRGGAGAVPLKMRNVPTIKDSDFKTPAAFQSLMARILGHPVELAVWPEEAHRPTGVKSKAVIARQVHVAALEQQACSDAVYRTAQTILDEELGIRSPDGSAAQGERFDNNQMRAFRRDRQKGREPHAIGQALLAEATATGEHFRESIQAMEDDYLKSNYLKSLQKK